MNNNDNLFLEDIRNLSVKMMISEEDIMQKKGWVTYFAIVSLFQYHKDKISDELSSLVKEFMSKYSNNDFSTNIRGDVKMILNFPNGTNYTDFNEYEDEGLLNEYRFMNGKPHTFKVDGEHLVLLAPLSESLKLKTDKDHIVVRFSNEYVPEEHSKYIGDTIDDIEYYQLCEKEVLVYPPSKAIKVVKCRSNKLTEMFGIESFHLRTHLIKRDPLDVSNSLSIN